MNIYVPESLADNHSVPIYLLQRTGGMAGSQAYTIELEQESLAAAREFEARLSKGSPVPVEKNQSYHSATEEWQDSTRGFIPRALYEGYILVSPGARGRDTVVNGVYVGRGELPMTIADAECYFEILFYQNQAITDDPAALLFGKEFCDKVQL